MKNDPAKIEAKIAGTIVLWNMFPKGCTVIAGLSGGADSMALTHYLYRHSGKLGIHLTAAHVNHGLRGAEADEDEAFVRSFCAENDIALRVLHTDVRRRAEEKSQGIEECGREVRYSFFRSLCGSGKIATAHTLSDSTETVLMNLAKGTGERGLCGIPPVRGNIVRPLIEITREEVEQYCACYGLQYRTDSTNFSDDFARNKIRLHAVPVFREINPAFESAVCRMTQILRCDEDYFTAEAKNLLHRAKICEGCYRLDILQQAPSSVLYRAAGLAVQTVAGSSRLEFRHLQAAEKAIRAGHGGIMTAGGIRCRACGSTFSVEVPKKELPKEWCVPFCKEGTCLPDGRVLKISPVNFPGMKSTGKFNKILFNNFINYDTILNISGFVRSRRPGDAYEPAHRGVRKTLKKLFNEAKLPLPQRWRTAVLELGGSIVWVEGFGVSQEACVSKDTENIAEIIIKECR